MRLILVLVSAALLSSCKTAGDIRERQITAQATSSRSVDDIAGCIALAIAGHGAEIGSDAIPNGKSVTWSIRVAGVKSVMEVYDIVDTGAERRVTVFNVHKSNKPIGALAGRTAACVQ